VVAGVTVAADLERVKVVEAAAVVVESAGKCPPAAIPGQEADDR